MTRENERPVVVITGASSGIGRATAHELALREADLVLTARDGEALDEVIRECEDLGGSAVAIPADTSRDQEIAEVARQAITLFGRIDVWINNASVYMLGRFDEVPPDAVRRLIDVNVIGYFNGARAALRQFRRQRRGVLINVGSVNSSAPQPFSSVYVASKHAIRGWSASLRMELMQEGLGDDVHVCTVMPAAVDTPIFQHAANFTGRPIRALDPTYPADLVARTIADLIDEPEAEVIVGRAGKAFVAQHTASPRTFERTVWRYIDRNHFETGTAKPSEGNLFRTTGPKAVSGGWEKPSPVRGKLVAGVFAAAVAAGAAALMVRRRS